MILVIELDQQEDEPKVSFNLTNGEAKRIAATYDRKGWDAQSWCLIIDTDKQTSEHYQVQYSEEHD